MAILAAIWISASGTAPAVADSWPICGSGPRITCVVDGDTIWMDGEKIRLLGLDTPELQQAGCPAERRLGLVARDRLQELLRAAGSIRIARSGRDRYGRTLAVVLLDEKNVARTLKDERLGVAYIAGMPPGWCDPS